MLRPLEDLHTVPPETPLKNALEIMGREDLNQLPVMTNGRLTGILSRAQILDYLRTRAELDLTRQAAVEDSRLIRLAPGAAGVGFG